MLQKTLFDYFARIVKKFPSKTALIYRKGEGISITYKQILDQAQKLAQILVNHGVKQQSRVAILIPNQPQWPIAFWAVQAAGAVAVPLDVKLKEDELKRILDFISPSAIFTLTTLAKEFRGALQSIPKDNILLLDAPDMIGISSIENFKPLTKMTLDPNAWMKPAAIFFTSGTTATPKGVMLTHHNLLSNVEAIIKLKLAKKNDVYISLLPLHHTYSFTTTCLIPLLTGATISYPTALNSDELLSCLKETKVTIFTGVPQLLAIIHNNIQAKIDKLPLQTKNNLYYLTKFLWKIRKTTGINLSWLLYRKMHAKFGNIRLIINGAAHLENKFLEAFWRWGFTVIEGYGLTETSPIATLNLPGKNLFGSAGIPLPGVTIKIISPDAQKRGEIAIQGPNVMAGYFNLPQETEKKIIDGWLMTGDLGYLDKKCFLHITGRKDDIIVLGTGKKVNPEEMEKYYSLSPYIKEICVFAREHLSAIVVPNEEYLISHKQDNNFESIIKDELTRLSKGLPEYKHLTGVFFSQNHLPRTALGKIMRHKVAQALSSIDMERTPDQNISMQNTENGEESVKLLAYLEKKFNRKLNLSDHLELDLGLDSLNRVELMLALEKDFALTIPQDAEMEAFSATTIQDLYNKVKPYLGLSKAKTH